MTIRFNWGLGIALVYAAFAAGTLTMVVIASQERVDLVSHDYYSRSLLVDNHLHAIENGRRSGAAMALSHARDGRATIVLTWAPHAAAATGTLTLYRPSGSSADRVFPITVRPGGADVVPLDDVPSGRWLAQLRWTIDGRDHYLEEGIVTP